MNTDIRGEYGVDRPIAFGSKVRLAGRKRYFIGDNQ